jgi:hypothetical protein
MTFIYSQVRRNGKLVGWTITIDGKRYAARTLKALREVVYRDLVENGPYVLIQD